MAIPAWPSSLPELRGLSQGAGTGELHPAAQETQFDDGPARVRRRQMFVETPLAMGVVLTNAQFLIFKAFHLNDLNTGARRFSAPVLLADKTIGTRICRIAGKVAWAPYGPLQSQASFTLMVQDW